ncbi:MAG: hypothetical protein R2836_01240 [Chitinophagales bacterium]
MAAELLKTYKPNHLISPTDFNCMGYCIPATIATKLAHPKQNRNRNSGRWSSTNDWIRINYSQKLRSSSYPYL